MRRDAWPLSIGAVLYVILVMVSWHASPDHTDVVIILYVAAGALEAAGICVTALDLRSKARAARDYQAPLQTLPIKEQIAQAAAASRGAATWRQLERVHQPVLAALDGALLRVAALLLLAGIAVGTAANIYSATKG